MRYIDAHAHLGDCRITDLDVTEEQLLAALEKSGVDAAIVQPYPCSSDEDMVHQRIYESRRRTESACEPRSVGKENSRSGFSEV